MGLKQTIKRALAKILKHKTITFEGLKLTGAFQDYGSLKAIEEGTHEVFFQKQFENQVAQSECVVDIGSHLGKYALLAAKQMSAQGQVYAFEPHPRTHAYLKKNVVQNQFEDRISLFSCAISNETGEANLQADMLQSDYTSLKVVRDPRDIQSVKISTATLVAVLPDVLLDVLKIDVEGAELLVLEGCGEMIQKSRENGKMPVLFIEANAEALNAFEETPQSLYQYLQDLGFKTISKICESTHSLPPVALAEVQCDNWLCQ